MHTQPSRISPASAKIRQTDVHGLIWAGKFERERLHVEAAQAMLAPGAPMDQVRPGRERLLHLGSIPQARQSNMSRLAMNIDTVSLRPILAFQYVEKGMVVAMGTSSVFTDREMGYTTTKPNKTQSRIYELEYWIFEDVMELMKKR
jgi:hypothetical protein